MDVLTPLRAIRKLCLQCSGGSRKATKWCPCDGVHSTWCPLWPYRLGKRPTSIRDKRLVTPAKMPSEELPLEAIKDASPSSDADDEPGPPEERDRPEAA